MALQRMKVLVAVLIIALVCYVQAGQHPDNGEKSCKKLGGRCQPGNRVCTSLIPTQCNPGHTCCRLNNRAGFKRQLLKKGNPSNETETKKNEKDKTNLKDKLTENAKGINITRIKIDTEAKSGKRLCKKTPKKCVKKDGICMAVADCTELIDKDLCKGASCDCCKLGPCKAKKLCKSVGGQCKSSCNKKEWELIKGCNGNGCKCCAPKWEPYCKQKKKCKKAEGYCVNEYDAALCLGKLGKGCKGKDCQCCVVDPVCKNLLPILKAIDIESIAILPDLPIHADNITNCINIEELPGCLNDTQSCVTKFLQCIPVTPQLLPKGFTIEKFLQILSETKIECIEYILIEKVLPVLQLLLVLLPPLEIPCEDKIVIVPIDLILPQLFDLDSMFNCISIEELSGCFDDLETCMNKFTKCFPDLMPEGFTIKCIMDFLERIDIPNLIDPILNMIRKKGAIQFKELIYSKKI